MNGCPCRACAYPAGSRFAHVRPSADLAPAGADQAVSGGCEGRGTQPEVASFYAEDAILMPPNAPPIKGNKAIQQDHERLFKEWPQFEPTATPWRQRQAATSVTSKVDSS